MFKGGGGKKSGKMKKKLSSLTEFKESKKKKKNSLFASRDLRVESRVNCRVNLLFSSRSQYMHVYQVDRINWVGWKAANRREKGSQPLKMCSPSSSREKLFEIVIIKISQPPFSPRNIKITNNLDSRDKSWGKIEEYDRRLKSLKIFVKLDNSLNNIKE